ncbi:MAG: hypothetical protein RI952_1691 [Bacteroidota bacterium]|jgi:hypothetical protein
MKQFLYLIIIAFVFASCEENISLDLPREDPRVVVDGYVETGLPPYIILSRSSSYFDPINPGALNSFAESGAFVTINDGVNTVQLIELDTVVNGISLKGFYAALDSVTKLPTMFGEEGKTYQLTIITKDNQQLSSTAKLQPHIALDSTWFKVQENLDSLGLAWAHLTDPDTIGNYYRWMAKRITKDDLFLAPIGSAFEDKFINGQSFVFNAFRGQIPNSTKPDDIKEEAGLFKKGDTIIVKFCAVDRGTFEFWRDAETQISNNGSPFAVPSNIKSNITGGLGVFATYSPAYDTIIAQ